MISDKYYTLRTLFEKVICDSNFHAIDDQVIRDNNCYLTYNQGIDYQSRIKFITVNYRRYQVTKEDLRYINEKVKKLVSILGTDASYINKRYIQYKLTVDFKPFIASEAWITAYMQLINLINMNKYGLQ